MTREPVRPIRLLSALIACAGLSVAAFAQGPGKPPPPRPAQLTEPGVLGGPAVDDLKVPGRGPGFGGEEGFRNREKRMSGEELSRALREALGPNAPEDVRASPELMEKLKAIQTEFRVHQRAYMEQHKDEFQKLRELGFDPNKARRDGGNGKGLPPGVNRRPGQPGGEGPQGESMGGPMGDMPKEERDAILQQAKALRDNAPKADDAFKESFALLNAEQQKAVQVKLDEFKERRNRREAENYVQRRLRDQDGPGGSPPGKAGKGKGRSPGPGEPPPPGRGKGDRKRQGPPPPPPPGPDEVNPPRPDGL